MKRNATRWLSITCLIAGIVSASWSLGKPDRPEAILKAVAFSGSAASSELLLRIEGGYSFKAFRPSEDTLFVDLKGVRAGRVAAHGEWSGDLLKGYRLLPYTDASGQPVVRLQVEMRRSEPFTAEQDSSGLRLRFGENLGAAAARAPLAPATPPATPRPSVAGTAHGISSRGLAEISNISVKPGASGETLVDVVMTRPTSYRVLRLSNPARLAVDLEGARHWGGQRTFPAQSPLVKGVRVGQFRTKDPAVVRVVVDLVGDPIFDAHAQPGGVRIELKSRTLARASVVPPQAPPAGALSAPAPKEEIIQKAAPAETGVIAAESEPRKSQAPSGDLAVHKSVRAQSGQAGSAPSADFQNALPASSGSKDVAAAGPQPLSPTPEALRASRAATILAAASPGAAEAIPSQAAAPAPAEEKPKYTGEPISLNLKDVDLKDFFRLIHEISGLNIIVDPNVAGSVTLVLDAVPWDQALDIVLKNNRLTKVLEGNVLRILRLETYAVEQEETAKLAAAREEAAPLVTVFRPVNYAKASTISAMLKSWTGGGALTKRGNILVDDRTNTLIISDIQPQMPVIESVITKLDKKAKQVQIEARIVEATADFSRNLQAILTQIAAPQKVDRLHIDSQSGSGASATPTNTLISPPASTPVISLTQTSASGFGAVAVSSASARFVLNAALAAAETRSQAKTISRPTIVTQNNVPGTIKQGTQVPIQTSINLTVTTTYIDATLTLTVTPQVTEDGNVFLNINMINASVGVVLPFTTNPQINTQTATTNVLVPDGGTVVFGGVTKTSRSRAVSQVPLLGSIPLLGHLFKATTLTDADTELLFFVSPKVLPT